MARKNRSLRRVDPRLAEIDIVGLYEELPPVWRLGSTDPAPPDWTFGDFRCTETSSYQHP